MQAVHRPFTRQASNMKTERVTFEGHSGDMLAARLDMPVW